MDGELDEGVETLALSDGDVVVIALAMFKHLIHHHTIKELPEFPHRQLKLHFSHKRTPLFTPPNISHCNLLPLYLRDRIRIPHRYPQQLLHLQFLLVVILVRSDKNIFLC